MEALIHVVSATQIVTADGQHALGMCGEDIGTYAAASATHPVGNYLWSGSPLWDRVTCAGCLTRSGRN